MSGWRHALSLSRQEVADSEPPGTSRLVEHELHRTVSGVHQTSEDHIQLVPTPTRHPADPLNWSRLRRYAILASVSYYAFAADYNTGIVAPALPVMAHQIYPPQSFAKLSQLVSFSTLLFGLSNILWVPLANIFGRRPIILFSLLIFVFASMWCGLAKSFESLLAARIVQGFGGGPAYTLAPDIVGEVFFVHERGRAMAVYTACLALGPFVGGLSGAYIAGDLGYKYLFWISTALAAFAFLLQFFLVPETLFDRAMHLGLEPDDTAAYSGMNEKTKVSHSEHASGRSPAAHLTYVQSLGFGTYRGEVLRHFAAPWLSLAFPGTWVVMLQYGAVVGGIVATSTVGPTLLAMPPYLWGNNVSLFSIGGLIGVVLGAMAVFLSADLVVKYQAKRSTRGLSEPETRLPLLFPGLFLAVTGMWTFGFSAAVNSTPLVALTHPSPHAWAGIVVGSGMLGAGLIMIPSIGFNYILEAYFAISADCFVMTTILRAVIAFAWTYFIAEWIESAGPALPFGIFGMIMAVFGLLAIPLWLFGKRMRIATAGYLPKHSNH